MGFFQPTFFNRTFYRCSLWHSTQVLLYGTWLHYQGYLWSLKKIDKQLKFVANGKMKKQKKANIMEMANFWAKQSEILDLGVSVDHISLTYLTL